MNRFATTLLALVSLAISQSVSALPMSFTFTARVQSVSPICLGSVCSDLGGLSPGDTVVGRVDFDRTGPDLVAARDHGRYEFIGAPYGFSLDLGRSSIDTDRVFVEVFDNGGGLFWNGTDDTVSFLTKTRAVAYFMEFLGGDSFFTSDAIPIEALRSSLFSRAAFSAFLGSERVLTTTVESVSFTAVPETPTLFLALIGILALAWSMFRAEHRKQ